MTAVVKIHPSPKWLLILIDVGFITFNNFECACNFSLNGDGDLFYLYFSSFGKLFQI